MLKKIYSLLFLFLVVIGITGCKNDRLELSGESTVEVGSSIVLTHNFKDSTDEIWRSSNEDIAFVYDGMVIGNEIGTVTITLTIGENVATKEITVVPVPLTMSVVGKNVVSVRESIQLSTEISTATEEEIVWQSSDETIATVNQNGLVRGIKPGVVTIQVSLLGNVCEFKVTVVPIDYALSIIGKSILSIGEEYVFDYDDGNQKLGEVEWKVSNEEIATISNDGKLKAITTGKVVVYLYFKGNE